MRDQGAVRPVPWERLSRAFVHPTMIRVVETIVSAPPDDLPGWSPKELTAALRDEPLGNIAYHVRSLARRGVIVEVDTLQRRGAVEHFYAVAS